jgi:hypothetical protein
MLSMNRATPGSDGEPVSLRVQDGGVDVVGTLLGSGLTDQASAKQPTASVLPLDALHFFVRYTLAEYVSFMWQHGGFLIRRRRLERGIELRAARARAPHL